MIALTGKRVKWDETVQFGCVVLLVEALCQGSFCYINLVWHESLKKWLEDSMDSAMVGVWTCGKSSDTCTHGGGGHKTATNCKRNELLHTEIRSKSWVLMSWCTFFAQKVGSQPVFGSYRYCVLFINIENESLSMWLCESWIVAAIVTV